MSLDFKKISIDDKDLIEGYFSMYLPKISEYTFTNLFMWGDVRDIRYSKLLEGIVFIARKKGKDYLLPPIGVSDCEKAFDILLDFGVKNNIGLISLVPEYQIKFLKARGVRIIPDRDNFDYVYKSEKLAFLKGWRLDGKRGFIKKFKNSYNFVYRRFELSDKIECMNLFEKWLSTKENVEIAIEEKMAFDKFINNFEKLSATGGVIEVDGRIIAFEFGEPLDNQTFVIHFEKADTSYIGSYQMINQQFVFNEIYPDYKFVNREQDMGVPGLRKAKLSYVPFRLVKKYNVFINP